MFNVCVLQISDEASVKLTPHDVTDITDESEGDPVEVNWKTEMSSEKWETFSYFKAKDV